MKNLYAFVFLLLAALQSLAHTDPVKPTGSDACATLTLTSGAGTDSQIVCIHSPIVNLSYVVGNGGTGASITSGGLPPGLTGTYDAATQVYSVSGTPSIAGLFTFELSTTGGDCPDSKTASVQVNPNATLALTSSAATSNQILCLNTALIPIVYTSGQGATGVTSLGLPTGVTGSFSLGVFTIAGMPTTPGTFNYAVSTSGGCDSNTLTGTIIVTPDAAIALTSAPQTDNQVICANLPIMDIEYTTNGATNTTVTGLPAGIASNYNAATQTATLSGIPTASGTFNYTVTTVGGCGSGSMSGTIEVMPCLPIDVTYTTTSNSITFNWDNVPGATGYAYAYRINDGPLIHGFSNVAEFALGNLPQNGTVTFYVSAQGAAAGGSITTEVLSAQTFDTNHMMAYPNPVTDILHLQSDFIFSKVQVFNMLGRLLIEQRAQSESLSIDMSAFAPGLYFVKAGAGDMRQIFSVIKQ